MKLLLDQGLPRSTAAILRENGWDVLHIGEIGMSAARDQEIIEAALAQGRTVVTLDADFHALIAVSGDNAPSVIRLRIEGLRGEALADLLQKLWPAVAEDVERGALVTVTTKTVRIHRLNKES